MLVPCVVLGLLAACSRGPGLDELLQQAADRHPQLLAELDAAPMVVETRITLPGHEPQDVRGEVRWQQGVRRVESWSARSPWEEGYLTLAQGGGTDVWEVTETNGPHLPLGAPQQADRLLRWFELSAVLAGARVQGRDEVDGRLCWVVELPLGELDGRTCYRLDLQRHPEAAEAVLAERDLELVRVDTADAFLTRDSWREMTGGEDPAARSSVTVAWAVERRDDIAPDALPDGVERYDGRHTINALEVIRTLWIDQDTLQVVRAGGLGPGANGSEEAELRWSDHAPLPGGLIYPRRLEWRVGGETYATVALTDAPAGASHALGPAFDAFTAGARLENLIQFNAQRRLTAMIDNPDQIYEGWNPGKDDQFQPDRVLALFDFQGGETVGDIGAGTGYFSFKLARAVGPRGRVFAADINPNVLATMDDKATDPLVNPHDNVVRVNNSFEEIGLAEGSLDAVLMSDVGFVRFRDLTMTNRGMLDSVRAACRPGARLVSIEKRLIGFETPVVGLGWSTFRFPLAGGGQPVPAGVDTDRPVDPATWTGSWTEDDADVIPRNWRRAGFRHMQTLDFIDLYDVYVFEAQ